MTKTPTDRFEHFNVESARPCSPNNVQIDEMVDPEKQQFLQDKAMKAETKDIVVEGREDTSKEKREDNVDPVRSSESLKIET